jgi:NAD(P)-dependent dehydrogenase (short-subunit alcohol dehydrogenase family)
MAEQRVAVVTGANRGMGLETCKQLAEGGMKVVLTSRNVDTGKKAAEELASAGHEVVFHQLDITDDASVAALAEHVSNSYGRCDVLVNNAGAIFDPADPSDKEAASFFAADIDTVRKSFETNALGAMRMCQALVPLMQKNGYGRVVNVSTGMAALSDMNGCWPGYRMSKVALNAITRIVADELGEGNIKINSVCPGFVKTDMGGEGANRSVEEGVDTTVWLATLRDDGPSGGFFRDCKRIDW